MSLYIQYIVPLKGLRKNTGLPRMLNRCVCLKKNERQQKKHQWHIVYKKQEKNEEQKSSEFVTNTKNWGWGEFVPENVSIFKNINSIANCKLTSKVW